MADCFFHAARHDCPGVLMTPVLTIFTDFLSSSNSFALRLWVFSSEVEKLKWFSFDLALKLALYTQKLAGIEKRVVVKPLLLKQTILR